MKTLLLFLMLVMLKANANATFAKFPHKGKLTATKYNVKTTDTIDVTYTLWVVNPGTYYIGPSDDKLEVIGKRYWEGFIKKGDSVTVTFKMLLKPIWKDGINKLTNIYVGFSFLPLSLKDGIQPDYCSSIKIIFTDLDESRKYNPGQPTKYGKNYHGPKKMPVQKKKPRKY